MLNVRNEHTRVLIILGDTPIGGTLYTIEMLKKYKKPYLTFNLADNLTIDHIAEWIINNNIHKLNVAGPRASQQSGIYKSACNVLDQLLDHHLLNQNQSIS